MVYRVHKDTPTYVEIDTGTDNQTNTHIRETHTHSIVSSLDAMCDAT